MQDPQKTNGEESIMSVTHCSDAAHNFILLQKLASLLGDFPEVSVFTNVFNFFFKVNHSKVQYNLGLKLKEQKQCFVKYETMEN